MNTTTTLLEDFCTPPPTFETDYDRKVLSNAQSEVIDFEGQSLHCYSWGEGKTVLLVHGWGSRASHIALLARHLARRGFRAVTFDGPSHGRSLKSGTIQQASMFEFGRALSAVAAKMGPPYALVGHSLGGLAAIFATAGYGKLEACQVQPKRLVLISTPLSIRYVIEVYCRREGLDAEQERKLTAELEWGFDFSVSDYVVDRVLDRIQSDLLIVHDEEDEEVPFAHALNLHSVGARSQLVSTKGSGHQKILADRAMLRAVEDFML